MRTKLVALTVALVGVTVSLVANNIKPAFTGTTLAGWRPTGGADWRIENGEIVGAVKTGPGMLVSDAKYQDVVVRMLFQCSGDCGAGVLLSVEKQGDQVSGPYVSLTKGDIGGYGVTFDAKGSVVDRKAVAGRGGARQPVTVPGVDIPAVNAPVIHEGWNHLQIYYRLGNVRAVLNGANMVGGLGGGSGIQPVRQGEATELGSGDRLGKLHAPTNYAPIALRVAGVAGSVVRFKNITVQDLTETVREEQLSNRFRMKHVNEWHFGDAIAAGDLNRDGNPDIVAGSVYYLGPDFKVMREIDEAFPGDPTDYMRTLGAYVADFTGDGWNDVLAFSHWPGSPGYLYVNPRGENRRWDRHKVISAAHNEEYAVLDMDGDGKTDVVFAGDGYVSIATPDPADPTKLWNVRHISETGPWGSLYAHGLGVGDINGDKRMDIVTTWGWWEQPATKTDASWPHHPYAFGRRGTQGGPGGSDMYVYDVNGDGLNDIVTSLEAHGWGLAWFEQTRGQNGNIGFERHMIMDKDPSQSHGVVFSQMHALAFADVDGDGLKDIITGKSWLAHWPPYNDPDGYGDAVVYWFKLTRKGKQVDFVPHLIHNYSGVGRQIVALDLNKDGALDIVNETRRGTYVFFGKKAANDLTAPRAF